MSNIKGNFRLFIYLYYIKNEQRDSPIETRVFVYLHYDTPSKGNSHVECIVEYEVENTSKKEYRVKTKIETFPDTSIYDTSIYLQREIYASQICSDKNYETVITKS